MNRNYTAGHYLRLVKKIRDAVPGIGLSTDIIAGYPTETDEDHRQTLAVIEQARYDGAYMFKYSPREGTKAWTIPDDVPENVKTDRLNSIIDLQRKISFEKNQQLVGSIEEVLVEGESKKSLDEWQGRTDTNKVVVFSRQDVQSGETVRVKIHRANSATLFGEMVVPEPVMSIDSHTHRDHE
jgi:tRNA-2-methylthio-N6-dimethylallyladenosine synthase